MADVTAHTVTPVMARPLIARRALLVATTVIVLMLSSCSSSDGGSPRSSPTSSATSTSTVALDPVSANCAAMNWSLRNGQALPSGATSVRFLLARVDADRLLATSHLGSSFRQAPLVCVALSRCAGSAACLPTYSLGGPACPPRSTPCPTPVDRSLGQWLLVMGNPSVGRIASEAGGGDGSPPDMSSFHNPLTP